MRNYFYVAVISIAALLLVVGLRTIYAFQGPDQSPPDGNGQLAADGDNIGIGTTSPDADLEVYGSIYFKGGNGDVNGFGGLNDEDLDLIKKWLTRELILAPMLIARGDVNGDGSLDSIDYYLIKAVIDGKATTSALSSYGKRMQDGIFHTSLGGKVGIAPAATRLEGGISFYPKPWVEPVASLDVRGGSYFHGGNGDVNGDGVISNIDSLAIVNWLNGALELTPEQYAIADVNGDGSVNSIDYFLLVGVIEGDITIEEAHHSVGKQKNDSSLVTTLAGDIGIGMSNPKSMNSSNRLEISKKDTNVRMTFKRLDASITTGNGLGRISFTGTAGASETNAHVGSFIQGSAQGTWSSSQSPGELSFYTTPTGSTASTKRMRIHNDGLVEIAGQLKIKGGSPVKGKFLKAEDNTGKAEWDYWPGDHLWGQGRPGIVVKNTSGECTVGDLKISRSIPSVRWEGAAASCPKGWWVCTAAERGTATCGTDTYTVKGCYSNYTNYGGSISAPTVYFYKEYEDGTGAAHLNELSSGTLWTFGYQTEFRNGVWSQGGVINAWVADAYEYPSTGVSGRSVSINGVISEGVIVCEKYPVWCCANK